MNYKHLMKGLGEMMTISEIIPKLMTMKRSHRLVNLNSKLDIHCFNRRILRRKCNYSLYIKCYFYFSKGCFFEAILSHECPPDPSNLPQCKANMDIGELCEAEYPLPGIAEYLRKTLVENSNYDVNNCDRYTVFRCV